MGRCADGRIRGSLRAFRRSPRQRRIRDGLGAVPARRRRLPRRIAARGRAVPLVRMQEIHGYAIVSDDDRIADASGGMPTTLRNEADWAYFQAELDRADLV